MPRLDRPFVGIPSFLRAPIRPALAAGDAAFAVLGIPFDEGSPFFPGSRMGPRALREHSLRLRGSGAGLYDPDTGEELLVPEFASGLIADCGDVDVRPTDVEGTFAAITSDVAAILAADALPIVLGGDHSISYPVFRAFERPVHVIQFDAHCDYAAVDDGLAYTNGHAFRHIAGLDTCLGLTQVGIRGLRNARTQVEEIRAAGNRVVSIADFRRIGPNGVAELLPEGSSVYVSIDIDALDISLVPGCVSGEPDGMTWPELRQSLAAIARRHDIVGFDFVEVNPLLDVGTGATAYLGAILVGELMGRIASQPRFEARRASTLAKRKAPSHG